MIVVSDTTPIHYLLQIQKIDLLPTLVGEVVVPSAVFEEMRHAGAPVVLREWIAQPPSWLQVMTLPCTPDRGLSRLDIGEHEGILLTMHLNADFFLVDEKKARREALRRKLPVIGTLGLLVEAARAGLVDLPNVIEALRQTNFYLDSGLAARLLKEHAEWKRSLGR